MRNALGERGEALAARYLEGRGWSILARNVRVARKEIDIIAKRGGVVAFVEVKTRRGSAFGHPLEAITPRKRSEIEAVAATWIGEYGQPEDAFRFDAIAVHWPAGGDPIIEHIEDAWGI